MTALQPQGQAQNCATKTQAMTKTLSSPRSPRVTRVSESRYVTSNSPLPVLDGGRSPSGKRGMSNGGNCDRFPAVFTVVFSKVIFIPLVPALPIFIYIMQREEKIEGDGIDENQNSKGVRI